MTSTSSSLDSSTKAQAKALYYSGTWCNLEKFREWRANQTVVLCDTCHRKGLSECSFTKASVCDTCTARRTRCSVKEAYRRHLFLKKLGISESTYYELENEWTAERLRLSRLAKQALPSNDAHAGEAKLKGSGVEDEEVDELESPDPVRDSHKAKGASPKAPPTTPLRSRTTSKMKPREILVISDDSDSQPTNVTPSNPLRKAQRQPCGAGRSLREVGRQPLLTTLTFTPTKSKRSELLAATRTQAAPSSRDAKGDGDDGDEEDNNPAGRTREEEDDVDEDSPTTVNTRHATPSLSHSASTLVSPSRSHESVNRSVVPLSSTDDGVEFFKTINEISSRQLKMLANRKAQEERAKEREAKLIEQVGDIEKKLQRNREDQQVLLQELMKVVSELKSGHGEGAESSPACPVSRKRQPADDVLDVSKRARR